jgi:hypothetical protein
MHPFFIEIKKYPELLPSLNENILCLPLPYRGNEKIKAILLGADPTNNGNKAKPGLKVLDTVFGIGSDFERDFFAPQKINIETIKLKLENLYIQNVCRNYFSEETSKNKKWQKFGEIWVEFLKRELDELDPGLPVLVTAEKIMKLLVPDAPGAKELYLMNTKTPLFSEKLNRKIFPLYRNPNYFLTLNKFKEYKDYLINSINE